MTDGRRKTGTRTALGRVKLPIHFGEQIIVSLLFNHDANPVHHRPDHAVQWLLGLAAYGLTGGDETLARVPAEERTYRLGTALLARQDVVIMPGIALAAVCAERFTAPEDHVVSLTTTFTYPLLVPTKGEVEIEVEAFEVPCPERKSRGTAGARLLEIEAWGPRLTGGPTRLLKMEVLVFRPTTAPEEIHEKVVAPLFDKFAQLKSKARADLPAIGHPAAISAEDARRYEQIIGLERPISPMTWQTKIPRVLTETIDLMRDNKTYQNETRGYYKGRDDEAERRKAVARYAAKEVKYGKLPASAVEERVAELVSLPQQLYAKQETVFDPRLFSDNGPATKPHVRFILDLSLHDLRLRRGIHRFFTGARLDEGGRQVFMGEATVTAQPLVTRELADFFREINYDFSTLRMFEYPPAKP